MSEICPNHSNVAGWCPVCEPPKEPLRTQTLGADDPVVSILEGHHDLNTFNRAFEAEGWSGGDWTGDHVSHEYWVKTDEKHWSPSVKTDPKAVPVTVGDW